MKRGGWVNKGNRLLQERVPPYFPAYCKENIIKRVERMENNKCESADLKGRPRIETEII